MYKKPGLILIVLCFLSSAYGQNERKVIRDGIRAYDKGEFEEAETEFRKAENINHESYEAEFNTGAALYNQEKYEETLKQYQSLLDQVDDPDREAGIWHNMGNSLLEAQKYAQSIEAYKNSLRINPDDEDSRYNLAYAKQKLDEQQQQQQQDNKQDQQNNQSQNGDQNKQNDQDRQEGDQDQQNENARDQDNQDGEQDQQKDRDSQEGEEENQQQQAVPHEISKDDAERLLSAIQQEEKDVKEKVDRKKAAAAKVKTEKDW